MDSEFGLIGGGWQDYHDRNIKPVLDELDRQINDIHANGAVGQLARMQVMNDLNTDAGATNMFGNDAGRGILNDNPMSSPINSREARPAPAQARTFNRIGPDTVLPDGSTVGDRVNTLADDINNRAQFTFSPYGPGLQIGNRSDPVSVARDVYQGTNFRKEFGGPGANYPLLGDAGNYAYGGISAKIGIPLDIAEGAAGAYSLIEHKMKDWGWPYGMDPSASRQIPKAYEVPWKRP